MRQSRGARVPVEVFLAGAALLAASAVLVVFTVNGRSAERAREWRGASRDAKQDVALSRLALEELVAGERSVDVRRDVLDPLARATLVTQSMAGLPGPRARGQQPPLPSDRGRQLAAAAYRDLVHYTAITTRRLAMGKAPAVATAAEENVDRVLRGVLTDLDRVVAEATVIEDQQRSRARVLVGALLAALLALFAMSMVLVRAHRRSSERATHRWAAVVESAAEGIAWQGSDGTLRTVNPAAAHMLGFTVEELVGGNAHALIHHSRPDGSPYPPEECAMASAARVGGVGSGQDVVWRKDGTSFPIEFTASPVLADDGGEGAIVVFRDISERLEVERAKDAFTSVVSHELRTPLTAIRAALGLLAGTMVGPTSAPAQRMLDIAVASTDRLVRLVNDILDIERVRTGRLTLTREHREAAELVFDATESMRGLGEERDVRLLGHGTPDRVLVDADRIHQVLTNIIGNAIKFSPAGSVVEVAAERVGADVVFSVTDAGRGIPVESLTEVFEPFRQVDPSDARVHGGTGLGLSISKSIVERHDGRIWAESGSGVGTSIRFALPVDGSSPDDPPAHERRPAPCREPAAGSVAARVPPVG